MSVNFDGVMETYRDRPIESYDDYSTASQYAMMRALISGDAELLRSIKTLMDADSTAHPNDPKPDIHGQPTPAASRKEAQ